MLRVDSLRNCSSFLELDSRLCLLLDSEERLSFLSLSNGNSLILFLKDDRVGSEGCSECELSVRLCLALTIMSRWCIDCRLNTWTDLSRDYRWSLRVMAFRGR